ncbi:hypothetical protein TWF106_000392 [Orbilia oligospora]|uniref:Uncharacterized protein n=1 Tax=Orbilia oligospora TaxID=2813651 RepID=A0A7C8VGC8_ORBOL|nr:hypothetical protein TWF679_002609 [Orbilia oligospora]KAF3207414.1 hypothetical protein TWF106_000392 [Orbilia oligospora]KAF3231627.1 hypothetical protein TWF191_005691 [Orbilia oligospora]
MPAETTGNAATEWTCGWEFGLDLKRRRGGMPKLKLRLRLDVEVQVEIEVEIEVDVEVRSNWIQSIDPYQSHKENYTNNDNCFYLILDPRRHTETIENRTATEYGPLV